MARDLTSDEDWAFFAHLILSVRAPNGRKPTNHRLVLDALSSIVRTGAPWRDLPQEFGKWSRVYRPFRRWTLAGLWELILKALTERPCKWSTAPWFAPIIRQRALKGKPRQGFDRSKGGFTTKIHLRVNAAGPPMRTDITLGQTSDYLGFDLIMDDHLPEPLELLADKGYNADSIRDQMRSRYIQPVIQMRKSRKKRVSVDRPLYRLRNLVRDASTS